MKQYLSTFKHGMPSHGGLGIGLNDDDAASFLKRRMSVRFQLLRDMSRLVP